MHFFTGVCIMMNALGNNIDMLDTADLHIILQDYAHTKRYYINDSDVHSHVDMATTVKGRQVIDTATQQNLVCNDTLTLYMVNVPSDATHASYSADTSSCTMLYHGGRYCSLVHASAELLCEYYASERDEHIQQTVISMYNKFLSKHGFFDTIDMSFHSEEYHIQVVYGILGTRMSTRRKACFLLAWKALYEIFATRKGE